MFSSCHVRVSEWIHTLELLECHGTPCSKQRKIWSLSDCNGTQIHNHLVCKQIFNHLAKQAKWLRYVLSTYLYSAFDCMFLLCHVPVSEWIHTITLYSCLNIKELLAQNRCRIWSLSGNNGTRTHNHLARKRTLERIYIKWNDKNWGNKR